MVMLFRILVALVGAGSILGTLQHWLALEKLPAERGIEALGMIGAANVRADIGGIFLGIAIFALAAAWTQSRHWLLSAIILVSAAVAGRLVSFIFDGATQRELFPLSIEIVTLAILGGALWAWGKKVPEGL